VTNGTTIIPSRLRFKSAPTVDQQVNFDLESKENELTEYDRIATVNLALLFDAERQGSTTFRPTFKISPVYDNAYTGTTDYNPFLYNLWYVDSASSFLSTTWRGFPQYYEFEFFRPNLVDQHIPYTPKSAYTYNWTYYLSLPFENNYTKDLFWTDSINSISWKAQDGIPFIIRNTTNNGTNDISFVCISEHNLNVGEYVELSISYDNNNLFQVNTLGDGTFGSDLYIFNLRNVGYTGNTFDNDVVGTFKKIIDITNSGESKSSYYIKMHKIITNSNDLIVTKTGFEETPFSSNKKFEFSSLTPNNISRVSQKNSSSVYTFTLNYDLDIRNILDNQKRPLNEIFLTIINKGFSGYFNKPTQGTGVKQGWQFNILELNNLYWDQNNQISNSDIPYSSYTKTNGSTETFYYNQDLKSGDTICGDFCEWNNITQEERIISPYYHKIAYNQDVFKSEPSPTTNPSGFYYSPHIGNVIRVFSDYIETGELENVDGTPSWAFYSTQLEQFRWRDIYSYGFKDGLNRGVDFPFLNFAHYPYQADLFRVISDGGYQIGGYIENGVEYKEYKTRGPEFGPISGFSLGATTLVTQPIIDECE